MKRKKGTSGSVFISYAHEDRQKVEPLVNYLVKAGFTIWWDAHIEVGMPFRVAIESMLYEAACVVVIWTEISVTKDFVYSEASIGNELGILFPVRLDVNARIPVGFHGFHYLDFTQWDGKSEKELQSLAKKVRALIARGPGKLRYQSTLTKNTWVVDNSQRIVSELQDLTVQIRSISDLFASDSAPIQDLRNTLEEISRTYRVVNEAILQFVTPAIEAGNIEAKPYLKMERGTLKTEIENGRGHCGLILTHYGRYGGIRTWLMDKLDLKKLQKIDDVFARLGTADGDLFKPLVEIGEVLTNESRVIVNLLLAKQEDVARQRILDGRMKLAPLEDQLAKAMQEIQQLERSLGFAE